MRIVVAGHWKSNKLRDEALGWMDGMTSWLATNRGVDVMVAVPAPYLAWCTERKPDGLFVLAQNVSAEGFGAHTGEYTAGMLKSCNVDGAIVGHSERRARFGDEDAVVAAKVDALIAADLLAVFCCGETLQEREGGRAEDVVLQQLQASVLRLPVDQVKHVIVAYELPQSKHRTCTKASVAGCLKPLAKTLLPTFRCSTAVLANQETPPSCFLRMTSMAG